MLLGKPTLQSLYNTTTAQEAQHLMHNPFCHIPEGAFDDPEMLGAIFETANVRASSLWPLIDDNQAACEEYLFYAALLQFAEAKLFLFTQSAQQPNQST